MISEEFKPRRLAGVLDYRLIDEMVIYDPASSQAASLNETARMIWELCDGTRTTGQICNELAVQYDISPHAIQRDIRTGIELLRELRLVCQ
jgi:hypothetical protein